jgi:hypothetical protein
MFKEAFSRQHPQNRTLGMLSFETERGHGASLLLSAETDKASREAGRATALVQREVLHRFES